MKVGTDGVLLGAWCASGDHTSPRRILDVGCGTGLIALMVAQRFPEAEITGIDISREAVEEATLNFRDSPWADRLNAVEADFNIYDPSEGRFDLIVSNPPFFDNGALAPDRNRSLARHDESLPLKTLIARAAELLSVAGVLSLILPADRENTLKFEAALSRFSIKRLVRVSTTPDRSPKRILAELVLSPAVTACTETLALKDGKGIPTREYAALVEDFYLRY